MTPGGQELVVSDAHDLESSLLSEINHRACYDTTSALTVHAGVVARGQDVVVIPGRPDAGKSTLVAALVRAGLEYLSDEALAIDLPSTDARAYPKPISLDRGSWPLFSGCIPEGPSGARAHIPPDTIRAGCVGSTGRLRLVIGRRYLPGSQTVLRRISRAAGVALLADHLFNTASPNGGTLATLDMATAAASCYKLSGSCLNEAVDVILQLLDESPSP